jgi:hypothetical protein
MESCVKLEKRRRFCLTRKTPTLGHQLLETIHWRQLVRAVWQFPGVVRLSHSYLDGIQVDDVSLAITLGGMEV